VEKTVAGWFRPFFFLFLLHLILLSVGSMLIAWKINPKRKEKKLKEKQLKNTNTSGVIFLFYVETEGKNPPVFRSDQANPCLSYP